MLKKGEKYNIFLTNYHQIKYFLETSLEMFTQCIGNLVCTVDLFGCNNWKECPNWKQLGQGENISPS